MLARAPATTTAAVAQSLTTDSPVTQLKLHSFRSCKLHSALAQFEKDERGHAAESSVDHCCFSVPLNKLRFHARQYICSDFVFLASFCRTSRVVVRTFHRASSEKSFPPSPSLCLADKCAAAVNFLSVLYTSIARSLPCYYYCCCRAVFDY